MHYIIPISLLGGSTIFMKLRSKIVKSLKIVCKVCAHYFVEITDRFEENSTAVIQGTYIKFFPHDVI